MPRKRRLDYPGAVQHVVAQGNDRRRIFMDDKDRTTFLNRLADVASAQMWDVHAYCLLDTHAHLVLRTRHGKLGSGMGRILGWYAHRFNGRHGHEGHHRSRAAVLTGIHRIELLHVNLPCCAGARPSPRFASAAVPPRLVADR